MFKQTRLSRICTKLAGSNTSTISESLPFVSETLKPLPCLLVIHLSTFFLHLGLLCNLDQSLLRTIANVSTTANEELSARFEEVDDLLPVLVQAVLDVLATFRLIRGAAPSASADQRTKGRYRDRGIHRREAREQVHGRQQAEQRALG
jgi:hypothetical protein